MYWVGFTTSLTAKSVFLGGVIVSILIYLPIRVKASIHYKQKRSSAK